MKRVGVAVAAPLAPLTKKENIMKRLPLIFVIIILLITLTSPMQAYMIDLGKFRSQDTINPFSFEIEKIDKYTTRIRVKAGWLYRTIVSDANGVSVHTTFVPN